MKRFLFAAAMIAAFSSAALAQPAPGITAPPVPGITAPPVPGTTAQPAPSTTIPPAVAGTSLQPSTVSQTLEPLPPPPPPAVYYPNVYVPPGSPPGPAIPLFKSGGAVVGAYGYYPYDTGVWLLGGTQGLTRQSGSFTMVYPAPPPGASEAPVVSGRSRLHLGRFCR